MYNRFDFLKKNQNEIYYELYYLYSKEYESNNEIYIAFGKILNIVINNLLRFNKIKGSNELWKNIIILKENRIISEKIESILNKLRIIIGVSEFRYSKNISEENELYNMLYYVLLWYSMEYFSLDKDDVDISKMDANDSRNFCELLIERKSKNCASVSGNTRKNYFNKIADNKMQENLKKNTNSIAFDRQKEDKKRMQDTDIIKIGKMITINDNLDEPFEYLLLDYILFDEVEFDVSKVCSLYIMKSDVDKIDQRNIFIYGKIINKEKKIIIDTENVFLGNDKQIKLYLINLSKKELEQKNEYKLRIKSIPQILIGLIHLERQKYDIYNEKLPVTIQYFEWAEEYSGIIEGYIEINRVDGRILCNEKADYRARGNFIVYDNKVQIINLKVYSNALKKSLTIKGDYIRDYDYAENLFEEGNYEEAFIWYKESASEGYGKAACKLGDLYSTGKGIERDEEKAFYWYKKGAESGIIEAQYWLGEFYFNGIGVLRDLGEGFNWYMKAAEKGDTASMCMIGQFYRNGFYVEQDLSEALKWYRKAAVNGDSYAKTEIRLIVARRY